MPKRETNLESVRMPFGKFKGRRVTDTPSNYLRWATSCPNLDPDLRATIRAELHRRAIVTIPVAPGLPDAPPDDAIDVILDRLARTQSVQVQALTWGERHDGQLSPRLADLLWNLLASEHALVSRLVDEARKAANRRPNLFGNWN